MKEQKFDYGMIDLSTMGRNLVYNMGDHAYTVIGFDNLIQAQRDDFGDHTYERNDKEGIFHTHWNQKK